ncbi:secreted protein containing DUF11 [Candidatus Magnetomorum sp. HK-1]|nr:secreted protein containing DUF11 [Candidatus Magnetomorum sp. HK-1]
MNTKIESNRKATNIFITFNKIFHKNSVILHYFFFLAAIILMLAPQLFANTVSTSVQVNLLPTNPGSFNGIAGEYFEIRAIIQNTGNDPLNDVHFTIQWESSFIRPQKLASSQLDAELINNTFQSTIQELSGNTSKTFDFKLLLADCSNPGLSLQANAVDMPDDQVTTTETVTCSVQAPQVSITQTIPVPIKHDPIGKSYELNISNSGGIAQNLSVSLDIPENFYLIENSMTNDWNLEMSVQDGSSTIITFDPPNGLFLGTNETIILTYKLGTKCEVAVGSHPFLVKTTFENANNQSGFTENFTLIDLKGGLVVLELEPIDPIPFAIEPGDRVTVKANITNNGDGALNLIDIRATWGEGFASPALGSNNISPSQVDNSYQVISDVLPGGESIFFEFSLDVISCDGLTIDLQVFDPCDPGLIFKDDSSPFLILKQPNMHMFASNTSINYCDSGTVQITLENIDEPADTRGFATNFSLSTTIPDSIIVSNVSAGWQYNNHVFHYPDGKINAGETVIMTFDIKPTDPCASVSGNMVFSPSYINGCGDIFAPPLFLANYQMGEEPTINIETTMAASGNDTQRLFLGESVVFTVRPTITQPENWTGTVIIDDVLSNSFIIQNLSTEYGTLEQNGNQLTWSLSPHTVAINPVLTIETVTTINPCEAGKIISNNVSINPIQTTCGCTHSVADDAGGYLQNKGDTSFEKLSEIKSIVNYPSENSYDVCSDMTVDYEIQYVFDSENTGIWTNSTYKDLLNGMQTYVSGSSQYRISKNASWTQISDSFVSTTNGLTIDLSFLTDVYNSYSSVSGKLLDLQYTLKPSPGYIAQCTPSASIMSQSDLFIANSQEGCDRGDLIAGKHFYQMVMVPVSRAVMSIDVNLNTNSVSKGQKIHPSILIQKVTPWPTSQVVVQMDTTNYYIHQPLSFSGFGGKTPQISIQGDQLILTFQNELLAGESGTVDFDASKKCTDNYDLSASLTYKDACDKTCTTQSSDQPMFKLEGDLILHITPDQVLVNKYNNLQWTIYVTNKGTGDTYNIKLNNYLKKIFEYIEARVNNVPITVDIIAADAEMNQVTIDLENLPPNGVHKIDFVVNTTGVGCDLLDSNMVDLTYGWLDDENNYHYCELEHAENTPVFSMPPSLLFMANSIESSVPMCGVAKLSLLLANTGMTHDYNLSIIQHLHQSGFTYIPGSASLDGVPINDPEISGTDLIWSYDDQQANYVPELLDLDIGKSHTIIYQASVSEASFQSRQISAGASWQKPCEKGGSVTSGSASGAGYAVPVLFPSIDVETYGWNESAGHTESDASKNIFGGSEDIIIWKVLIKNTSTATAKAFVLRDFVTTDLLLNAVASTPDFSDAEVIANLTDISVFPEDIPGNTTKTLYFRGVIQEECINVVNTAVAEWGCPDDPVLGDKGGITSPNDNSDTANLTTIPIIQNLNISHTITEPGTSDPPTFNGKVTISITNNGGTARNIRMTDTIPDGFIIDSTAEATISSDYGNLEHLVISGTFTQPIFSLYKSSSTINSNDKHDNILRYKESAILTFYIIRNTSLDTQFDPDIRQESVGNGLDPANPETVYNQVIIDYENACGTQQTPSSDQISILPTLMDLDIDLANPINRIVNKVGDSETFQVNVKNRGKAQSTNANVSIVIGNAWTGTLPSGCSGNIPGMITCDIDSLQAEDTWQKNFSLEIAQETDVTFEATVTGKILNNDISDTGLIWANDVIRARVIGFRIERELLQTTESGSSGKNLLIGEDAAMKISAIFFGLKDDTPITNFSIKDTFENGLGFISDEIKESPGNKALSTHTTPDIGQSGDIDWSFDTIDTSGSFIAETHIRSLNKALNDESVPNIHNATLMDSLDASFSFMGSAFNKNTRGFPSTDEIQTQFTVQTPQVSISKKVRNVTQELPPGENVFSATVMAHAGDILEYQLIVENASNHAPAYDVIITDSIPETLVILPFQSDTIDNDGDGQTDETNEGIDNGGGSNINIQFDGTHSTALAEIVSAGQSILTYRVIVANLVQPSEIIENTVQLTHDTLTGEYGSQFPQQGAIGTSTGSRQYNFSAKATVSIEPIDATGSKYIMGLSTTQAGGAFPFSGPQNVVIGEEIDFELNFSLVPSTISNWQLYDQLPDGMTCISADPITLSTSMFSPGGIIAPVIEPDGSRVIWNFGDQLLLPSAGEQSIRVLLRVRIQNIVSLQAGTELINANAAVTYQLKDTLKTIPLEDVSVIICEPQLTIKKIGRNITKNDSDDFSHFSSPDAGDIVEFSIQITNSNENAYIAFNMGIIDTLSPGWSYYTQNTPTGDISQAPDVTGTGNLNDGQVLKWGRYQNDPEIIHIPKSGVFSFRYQLKVHDEIEPFQELENQMSIDWSSMSGENNNERNGSGGINDYQAQSQIKTIVPDNYSILKTRIDDSFDSDDNKVRVGDIVKWKLEINLQEGSIDQLIVTDIIPDGISFLDTMSINGDTELPYEPGNAFQYNSILEAATPTIGQTQQIKWQFGRIVNEGNNNTPDSFEIIYRTRIMNTSDTIETSTTRIIENTASLNYQKYDESQASAKTSIASLSVVQPQLSINKSLLSPQSPQVFPGDLVTYRLQIYNTGDAPAYNVEIRDILPEGMKVLEMVQATLNGQNLALNFLSQTNASVIVWKLSDAQQILPNNSLRLDFKVEIDPLLSTGKQMDNTAVVDRFYSKPSDDTDERRQYASVYLTEPVSVYVPGLTLSPDHQQASLPGTPVVYNHRLDAFTGTTTGKLSFSIESQKDLPWVIYLDSNNNGVLDFGDSIWNNGDDISTISATIFLRTVLAENLPAGFQDTTVLTAKLDIGQESFIEKVTDITRIIASGRGDMHSTKSVAIDTDCDTQLSDESPENQSFNAAKSIAPGECAIYQIYFLNQGLGKLHDIVVKDETPAFSTYISNSAVVVSVPSGITPGEITVPANNGRGSIIWPFEGELLPGGSGIVSYEVRVGE